MPFYWFPVLLLICCLSFTQAQFSRRRNDDPMLVERSLEHDGLVRWFLEYRPVSLISPAPLVLLLHGGTQSMREILQNENLGTGRWLDLSDTNGFLLLVPNGVNLESGDTYGDDQNWSDLRFAGTNTTTYDDVGFLSLLVHWSITEAGVDPSRVYVTGASNGGLMTYTVLLQTPQLYAAGAAFIANLPAATVPTPMESTPMFIMNGDEDRLMPWEGGDLDEGARGTVRSALATRDYWIQSNGADAAALTTSTLPNRNWFDGCRIQREVYPASSFNTSSTPVHFYRMSGGGHSMPSIRGFLNPFMNLYDRLIGGPSCHDVNGADLAWEFLSSFTYYTSVL